MSPRKGRGKNRDIPEQFDASGNGLSRRDRRKRRKDMEASPQPPESWRDVVSTDYDYPAEMDDLSRRERRHAKKDWRRDDHTQRMAWLRQQRQAEPVSPVSILVVVILLGILILGIGGGLPKILGGDEGNSPLGC